MSSPSPYQAPGTDPTPAARSLARPLSLRDPVGRVRLIGMVEGVSFLLLLFIAMPLKYFAGMPKAVSVTGMAHGVLFLLFVFVIFQAWGNKALTTKQSALAFISSLLPFGPFLIDRRLAESLSPADDPAD